MIKIIFSVILFSFLFSQREASRTNLNRLIETRMPVLTNSVLVHRGAATNGTNVINFRVTNYAIWNDPVFNEFLIRLLIQSGLTNR